MEPETPTPTTDSADTLSPTAPMPAEEPAKHDKLAIAGVVVACVATLVAAFAIGRTNAPVPIDEPTATTSDEEVVDFPDVELEARAAYVYDVRNDRALFSKNGDTTLPLASLTKILTAIVATSDIPQTKPVVISSTALATEGESGLTQGEHWNVVELARFMLVVSSNDAATALRETYETHTGGSFISAMNNRASKLGLDDITIVNETGLDRGFGKEANSGPASDVARLLAHAVGTMPGLFDATRAASMTFSSLDGTKHVAENTNLLIDDIPWAIGAKTGFTDSAGGNLAIAFDASVGRPIVIVVMGSSRDGRFTDMKKLVDATLKAMSY